MSGGIPTLWLGLKHLILEKFAYCYGCALPQDHGWNHKYPECHCSFIYQQGVYCPWANFIYIALWMLWHDIDKRALLVSHFSPPCDISYNVFEAWIGTEEHMVGESFKGLKVFHGFVKKGHCLAINKSE